MKTLIVTNYYLPGIKGGGPVNSIKNIVDSVNGNFDILTKSKDVGEKNKYKKVKLNNWNKVNKSRVFYLDNLAILRINKILKMGDYDIIYLNSVFATLSIYIYFLTIFRDTKVVIAPRGELNINALNIKKYKKIFFMSFLKIYSKINNVKFHATSNAEKKDIQMFFKNDIQVISNLPSEHFEKNRKNSKEVNKLKIMCVARINKMKNIHYAIDRINEVKNGEITFDIYGAFEDINYKKYCESISLNDHVSVNFIGNTTKDVLKLKYQDYDLFFLPTLGENFGHSIIEAIQNHMPVLISDNTPWKNLYAKNVGFEYALDDKSSFVKCLNMLLSYSNEDYENMFLGFERFITTELNTEENINRYYELLLKN